MFESELRRKIQEYFDNLHVTLWLDWDMTKPERRVMAEDFVVKLFRDLGAIETECDACKGVGYFVTLGRQVECIACKGRGVKVSETQSAGTKMAGSSGPRVRDPRTTWPMR